MSKRTEKLKQYLDDKRKIDIVSEIADQLGAKRRSRSIYDVYPRFYLCEYLRKNTQLTLEEIGEVMGGYKYSTVIHAIKTHRYLTEVKDFDYLDVNRETKKLLLEKELETTNENETSSLAKRVMECTDFWEFSKIKEELKKQFDI